MRTVIDTSAWIELLARTPTGVRLRSLWPTVDDIIVPTLVQLEIAKWAQREAALDRLDSALAYLQICEVVVLDTPTALRAAELCVAQKLATADAVIYATALEQGAGLLTCDAHFDRLDGVQYVPKSMA